MTCCLDSLIAATLAGVAKHAVVWSRVQTAARVGVLQPFLVKSIREDIRNVVLSDAARQSLSSAGSMYSRPSTRQAKPPQPRSQQRTHPAQVQPRQQISLRPDPA